MLEHFPSFRDTAEFKGRRVKILKRVQILVGDLWGCFEGKGFGEFTDIDSVTMFADYRVPQALLSLRILKYSDALMERLHKKDMFTSGESAEVEIRGGSIWAVELLRRELAKQIVETDGASEVPPNAILIDFYLWDYAKQNQEQIKQWPIHRIRTFFY